MAISSPIGSSGPPSLRVMEAVREGWQGFSRAPWVFIGFTLLAGVLNALCSLLQGNAEVDDVSMLTAAEAIRSLIGSILGLLVSLWATTGMLRGAWSVLEGGHPTFTTFTRWDGRAAFRLFRNGLVLGILLVVILALSIAIGAGLSRLNQLLAFLPFLVAFGVFVYLVVNQKFLAPVALLEGKGPIDAIQRGRSIVDPQWGQVLLLALMEFLVLLAGLFACVVGLFVAVPVVMCISIAAYRQIFGTEDLTGLLTPAGS